MEMTPQQQRGRQWLIGFIVGAIAITVAAIASVGATPQGVVFLVLELALFTGLYQGRPVPRYLAVCLLLFFTGLAGATLVNHAPAMPAVLAILAAGGFFLAFAVMLLVSPDIAAFLAFRQQQSTR